MGTCASVEDVTTSDGQRVVKAQSAEEEAAQVPLYLMDRSAATPLQELWFHAVELTLPSTELITISRDGSEISTQRVIVPEKIKETAPKAVRDHCNANPADWERFLYYALAKGFRGLDEIFDQCHQVASTLPQSKGKKGKGKSVSATSGNNGADELQAGSPEKPVIRRESASDYFTGAALPHLMEMLGLSVEAHILYIVYHLVLAGKPRDEAVNISPSKMKAQQQHTTFGEPQNAALIDEWVVTRGAWITGWVALGCFSMADVRRTSREIGSAYDRLTLDDDDMKAFHKFLFRFMLKIDNVPQVAVAKDDAVTMWRVELNNKWPLLEYFTVFVAKRYSKSFITADQWDILVDFAQALRYEVNLLQYDADGSTAWPVLMDQFVEETVRMLQEQDGSISALSQ